MINSNVVPVSLEGGDEVHERLNLGRKRIYRITDGLINVNKQTGDESILKCLIRFARIVGYWILFYHPVR
jgi:hypothetical protein